LIKDLKAGASQQMQVHPDHGLTAESKITKRLDNLHTLAAILQICLLDQQHTDFIEEDTLNKLWRPLPFKRIIQAQARNVLVGTCIVTAFVSWHLEVVPIFGMVHSCYSLQRLRRRRLQRHSAQTLLRRVFHLFLRRRTLHRSWASQHELCYVAVDVPCLSRHYHNGYSDSEFCDEVGDKARGRHLIPTEMGRKPALVTVILTVAFWSVYAPLGFLASGWRAAVLSIAVRAWLIMIAITTMGGHDAKTDRKMYKVWCLWIVACCGLPVLAGVFA
jgi:hypothetical protein